MPYWVTDATYTDPRDDSPAQFIAWGLKPDTGYRFRIRTYSGYTTLKYGSYSIEVIARTPHTPRGTSPTKAMTPTTAKAPILSRMAHLGASYGRSNAAKCYCGRRNLCERCHPHGAKLLRTSRAVVLVTPGETATLTSQPPRVNRAIELSGSFIVIDGLALSTPATGEGEYDVEVRGHHNALLNVDFHPPSVPSFKWGMVIFGGNNLIYRSYLHDYGSPDPTQNPDGNGGFVLTLSDGRATGNVIWSNHLTRGGHHTSLCHRGCHNNVWLNNVMDGGWGRGFSPAAVRPKFV